MERDNLPLDDHNPIIETKLEIMCLFHLGTQDENHFYTKWQH